MGIDPSYIELARTVVLPFTEEFNEAWRGVRIICFGMLFSAVVLLFMGFAVLSGPHYDDARGTISMIGFLALCGGLFLYVLCAAHAYSIHKRRLSDRDARYRSYDE